MLTADNPGLQLEVDRERTAEFLHDGVRLEAMPPLAGLPRWKLYVQVAPNAALGPSRATTMCYIVTAPCI